MLLFPAVLRCVDFSRSGIWGKLGAGVQGICLKSCAKFPQNCTMFPQTRALQKILQAWYSKLLNGSGNLSPESRPRWKMIGCSVWSLYNHIENDDYIIIGIKMIIM